MQGGFDFRQIWWPYWVALVVPPTIALSVYYLWSDPVPHLLSPFLNSDGFFYAYHAWYTAVVDASGGVTDQLIPASLYTSYLSAIIKVFGFGSLTLYLGNGLLFLASSMLMTAATRHIYGTRAALIASGLFSLCAPLIFFTGTTMKTMLVVSLFAGFTYFAARFIRTRNLRWSLLTIPVVFLAAIDRHNAIVLLPAVFLLHLFYSKVSSGRAIAAFVFTAFASFALMSSIVNWEMDELEPSFNAPMGLNFYVGNNERANGGYTSVRGLSDDLYGHRIGIGPFTEKLAGQDMSRQEISAFWLEKSFKFIAEQPAEYVELQLKKLALLFSQYAYGAPEQLAVWRDENLVLQLAFVDFSVLIALAIIGLLMGRSNQCSATLFLAGCFGLYAFSTWIFFVTERYKLPLYVFLLPLAAMGLDCLISTKSIRVFKFSALALLLYGMSVGASSMMVYGYGWPENKEAKRTDVNRSLDSMYNAMDFLSTEPSREAYHFLVKRLTTSFYVNDAAQLALQGLEDFPADPVLLDLCLGLGIRLSNDHLIFIVRENLVDLEDAMRGYETIKRRLEKYERRVGSLR